MNHLSKLIGSGLLALLFACTPSPTPNVVVAPKSVTFTAGDAGREFTATVTGSIERAWSLSPTGVGTLSSTNSSTTIYTPPASVNTVTTVILTSTASGVSDSATITVNPRTTLNVSPTARTVVAGSAATGFSASLNNASGAITWSLNPNLGTLSATTGISISYTPPASVVASTTVTLTATSGSLNGSTTIIVNPFMNIAGQGRDIPLQRWPVGFTGTITFVIRQPNATGNHNLISSPIDTQGVFSYTLPPAPANLLLPIFNLVIENCAPSNFASTNPNTRQVGASIFAGGTAGTNFVAVIGPNSSTLETNVRLVYVDSSTKFTGTCTYGTIGINRTTYDLDLIEGWNWVIWRISRSNGDSSVTVTSPVNLPSDYIWGWGN